jgi:hypothetical protein
MKTRKRVELLKDSIVLLQQARSGLHSKSVHSLALKIDEVIEKLESAAVEKPFDPDRISAVLKLLAQGFDTIPAIARIIETISNR